MVNKMYWVAALPLNAGAAFANILWAQSETSGQPGIEEAELARLLIDAVDLRDFDQRTLESNRRLYDASRLQMTPEALRRRADTLILRGNDEDARERVADCLGIAEVNETIALLIDLKERDADLVRLLMEGRIGSAIRQVPVRGYPGKAFDDNWTVESVLAIIACVLRWWIAHDLQLEAAATHVRIFRSTGCDVLDRTATGLPITQAALIARIMEEIALYEAVARLFYGEALKPEGGNRKAKADAPSVRATIAAENTVLSIRWPSCLQYGHAVTREQAAFIPGSLLLRAQLMLSIWRRAHGAKLEEVIHFRMTDARWRMQKLRRELDAIMADPSLRRQRALVQKGTAPLTRLWLACLNAVRWTDAIRAPKVARARIGWDFTDHHPDFVDQAIMHVRKGEKLTLPKLGDHHRDVARELFFALRCAIVRDPEHLPSGLTVQTEAGQAVPARWRDHAERLCGSPLSFAKIYAHVEKRHAAGGLRNSKEVLSHAFVTPANAFLKAHANAPTAESIRIIKQAAGTAHWRLTQ